MKPVNLIFDATVLTNYFYKNDNRSGIFFAAFNILDELLKRSEVSVSLYVAPEKYADGARLKDELYPNANFIQDFSKHNILKKIYVKLKNAYSSVYGHIWLRKTISIWIILLDFLFNQIAGLSDSELKSYDAFLSPVYKIPNCVRKNLNVKPYIILYDCIPFLFSTYYPQKTNVVADVMRTALKNDYFFPISRATQEDYKKLFPVVKDENSSVILLAAASYFSPKLDEIDFKYIQKKYNLPQDKKYVFSLCTLEPRKNLLRAVKNFLIFLAKNKIDDLVWVMGGSAWVTFIETLKKEGAAWNPSVIIRAGYVDDDDLPVLYSNAEWFVYTSQYEGFGLPPLEAMQCGCPVITSNNSSLPEVVGDAGIMIDWDSDEQHVKAYEKLYFDENLRKDYGRRAQERAKIFSWKNTVDEIIGVMKERNRYA